MKKLLVIFLLASCLDVSAQDSLRHWSFGAGLTLNRVHRISVSDDNLNDNKKMWDSLETPAYRLSASLNISYTPVNRIGIYSGLGYLDMGYRIDSIQEASMNSITFHYRYLELPIGMVLRFRTNSKSSIVGYAALSGRYLLKDKMTFQRNNETATYVASISPEVSPFVIGVNCSLGYSFDFTQSAGIDLMLSGSQALSSVASGGTDRFLNAIGLNVLLRTEF